MKVFILNCFLLIVLHSYAQDFVLPGGEYIDTTVNEDSSCKDYNLYFYQVHGKYPESSSTILNKLHAYLKTKNNSYSGSGYITFQFMIHSAGTKMKKTS